MAGAGDRAAGQAQFGAPRTELGGERGAVLLLRVTGGDRLVSSGGCALEVGHLHGLGGCLRQACQRRRYGGAEHKTDP